MHRRVIDRLTDTAVFRCMLVISAIAVLPVLFMGVTTTFFGAVVMLGGHSDWALESASLAIPLLSIGGALGFLGYQRAHWGLKDPSLHNMTVTLVFLAAGVLAALSVAGFVLVTAFAGWFDPWGPERWWALAALFAAANLVWAFAGIAWMQRLLDGYAEKTGRAFDGLPVVLLSTAIALVIAATLKTITL